MLTLFSIYYIIDHNTRKKILRSLRSNYFPANSAIKNKTRRSIALTKYQTVRQSDSQDSETVRQLDSQTVRQSDSQTVRLSHSETLRQ